MSQPDEIIHQPLRMKIMAALKVLPTSEALEFVRLRDMLKATEGNLGAHITTLEKSGYVQVDKDFHLNRPRTRVSLTKTGRRAFQAYVDYLRDLLDA